MDEKLIYVVDDEKNIRELIKSYFIKEGWNVRIFSTGKSVLEAYNLKEPDMIVLDIMMPDISGHDVLKQIRKKSSVPVIMVSALGEEIDRILGIEMGSDDYLTKPFSPRELIARVKAVLRRVPDVSKNNTDENKKALCGDICIDKSLRTVKCKDNEIELTTKEFDFFEFLVKNKNCPFTRQQLLTNIWGYDYIGDERAVDDLVKRIRKKLKSAGSGVEILTVWGYGYKVTDDKKKEKK